MPAPVLAFILEKILAPLAVEVLVQLMNRRSVDPEFKAKTDGLFRDIARAGTIEERKADAKDLQSLINS